MGGVVWGLYNGAAIKVGAKFTAHGDLKTCVCPAAGSDSVLQCELMLPSVVASASNFRARFASPHTHIHLDHRLQLRGVGLTSAGG